MAANKKETKTKPKPAYKNADRATYFRDEVTGEKYYQCPVCPKRLKGHLTIHLRTHNGWQPWKCKHCSKKFSQKCNLQTHVKMVHKSIKVFQCQLCPKKFGYKKNLERHTSGHLLERPYQCPHCPRRFPTVDWLCRHKRVHTGELPYDCIFCPGARFAEITASLRHLRNHIQEKPHFCTLCSKSFIFKGDLMAHIKWHLGETETSLASCIFCGVTVTSPSLFSHIRSHIGEQTNRKVKPHHSYQCPFCDNFYTRFSDLRNHLSLHLEEHSEQCAICLKRFRYRYPLNQHLKNVHKVITVKINQNKINKDILECILCSKRFSIKIFRDHFLTEHTKQRCKRT